MTHKVTYGVVYLSDIKKNMSDRNRIRYFLRNEKNKNRRLKHTKVDYM